ncbi:MAG: ScpA family protein [Candidatus Micrarchaeaceae archaeon]
MATGENAFGEAVAMGNNGSSIDLEELVSEATWKDLLLELVRKNKIDPWNIDIIEIVDKYIDAIKLMKILDLHMPANIILAASILLRFKSETIELYDETTEGTDEISTVQRGPIPIEELVPRFRLAPKRRVTLQELIEALDEAMQLKKIRETQMHATQVSVPMHLDTTNIEETIESLYKVIVRNIDKEKMLTFSRLLEVSRGEDVLLRVFVPLLFLAHRNKIIMTQEKFFGEIFIMLNS